MDRDVMAGGCLCGAVRYRAHGRPTVSMVCHCRTCTKAAGAPAVPWVTFAATALAFVAGTPAELHSSAPVVRTFCGSCGTPLTYVHAERPSEIDVTTCSLDDPDAFPPSHHAWERDKPSWLECAPGVPGYEEGTPA